MSKLHVNQIAGFLRKTVAAAVDASDLGPHAESAQRDKAILTRALAAFAVSTLVETPPADLLPSVTDGVEDGGIDLVYFDPKESVLYLAQSKWHSDGHGSIELGDLLKFLDGVKKILDNDLAGFNARVQAFKADIESALYNANSRFVLVLAHTGQEALSAPVSDALSRYLAAQNDTSELMRALVLTQTEIHNAIATGVSGAPIGMDVQLASWGQVREPYFAVYGQVPALDVAKWLDTHGSQLFEKNLRHFLGSSTVNEALVETLIKEPENFWYFNNGITAIANTVAKKPIGGNSSDFGVFECSGFCVVNGAQTVGSIHSAAAKAGSAVGKAHVSLRIISIEDSPSAFSLQVTKCTNTQNSIEKSDFVALDPEQERLRRELQIEGVEYSYKAGLPEGPSGDRFDLLEATVALACAQKDVSAAVLAKREIGKLWDDIAKAPYKQLFNASLQGPMLWELVRTLRAIDVALQLEAKKSAGRDNLICVHGNRFIQWLSMQRIAALGALGSPTAPGVIEKIASDAARQTVDAYKAKYPDSYPASLFKNLKKCQALGAALASAS